MNHGGMSVQVNGQRPVGRVFLAHVIVLVLRPPLDFWARVRAKTMYCTCVHLRNPKGAWLGRHSERLLSSLPPLSITRPPIQVEVAVMRMVKFVKALLLLIDTLALH
jgi:hypothetical protein